MSYRIRLNEKLISHSMCVGCKCEVKCPLYTVFNQCITVQPSLSDGPYVHLLHFFYKLENDLAVLYFPNHRRFPEKIILILFTWEENFLEKCSKSSSKIYKHLVEQKCNKKLAIVIMYFFIRHTLFVLKFAQYLNSRRFCVREAKNEHKIVRTNSSDSKKIDLR